MKAGDQIKYLKQFDPETQVWILKDQETAHALHLEPISAEEASTWFLYVGAGRFDEVKAGDLVMTV